MSQKLFLSIAAVMVVMACSASAATASFSASTGSAIVGGHQAVLYGSVWTPPNEPSIAGFQYGTTTAYGSETGIVEIPKYPNSEFAAFELPVKELEPETTYHYRAVALSDSGKMVFGADRAFTTRPPTFRAAQYPATLSGAQDASSNLVLTIEKGLTQSCKSVTATGSLTGEQRSVNLTPTFGECTAFGLVATVKANGCSYEAKGGDIVAGSSTMDVDCPEGSAIEITAGTCQVKIPAQSEVGTATTYNSGASPRKVRAALSLTGVEYIKVKDGFLCPLAGTGTLNDGTLSGIMVISATNSLSNPIDLWLE